MNFLIGNVKVSISLDYGIYVEWDNGYFEISGPVMLFSIAALCMILLYSLTGK